MAMEPRMRNLMQRISKENDEAYFLLNAEDREDVAANIAQKVIQTTVEILNGYVDSELPDIMELAITNLTSLEAQFVELELYAEALMMKDAVNKIQNDLSVLVKQKL